MLISNHWLQGVEKLVSPHCNERPIAAKLDTLVIHCASLPPGEFTGDLVADLFMGKLDDAQKIPADFHGGRVSAHVWIRRCGLIQQFVPFHLAAWHAGESLLGNRTAINDFSIGIELEGLPGLEFTDKQYEALKQVTEACFQAYPSLKCERIVGHCDIAPMRKSDPGSGFDWVRYLDSLA